MVITIAATIVTTVITIATTLVTVGHLLSSQRLVLHTAIVRGSQLQLVLVQGQIVTNRSANPGIQNWTLLAVAMGHGKPVLQY